MDMTTRMGVHPLIMVFLFSGVSIAVADAPTLEELIAEIGREEARYNELEFVATMNFERSLEQEADLTTNGILSQEARVVYSVREGCWRYHIEETAHSFLNDVHRTFNGAWDGVTQTTLCDVVTTEAVSNAETSRLQQGIIWEGPRRLLNPFDHGGATLVRPHMAVAQWGIGAPLSMFLAGLEYDSFYTEPATDLGDAEWDGLRCRVISIDRITDDGRSVEFYRLWLAYERNLIPVHAITYNEKEGEVIPFRHCTVTEWQEPIPGVFFPKRTHEEQSDVSVTHTEGREIMMWHRDWVVESVSLTCDLSDAEFEPPVFPDGTEVISH